MIFRLDSAKYQNSEQLADKGIKFIYINFSQIKDVSNADSAYFKSYFKADSLPPGIIQV